MKRHQHPHDLGRPPEAKRTATLCRIRSLQIRNHRSRFRRHQARKSDKSRSGVACWISGRRRTQASPASDPRSGGEGAPGVVQESSWSRPACTVAGQMQSITNTEGVLHATEGGRKAIGRRLANFASPAEFNALPQIVSVAASEGVAKAVRRRPVCRLARTNAGASFNPAVREEVCHER